VTEDLGLLCMSYGTARGPDDLVPYLTHIRRGRTPPPELIDEMRARYDAIGGISPLIGITERQVRRLEEQLNREGRRRFRAYHGMKHQSPYIEDVVEQIAADGLGRMAGLVLAPHYSRMSVGEYIERAEKAAADTGMETTFVESYHRHPAFVAFVKDRVHRALESLPDELRNDSVVVFSAHSLPVRILEQGDPYAKQLEETAQAVAEAEPYRYRTAWQSAGRTGEAWLGPDVNDRIRALANQGWPAVIVAPVGFVSDHLEVLYDVDIEARRTAEEAGVMFARTRSPNADPEFLRVLAAVVNDHLEREGW
jgi:ferrochelatase